MAELEEAKTEEVTTEQAKENTMTTKTRKAKKAKKAANGAKANARTRVAKRGNGESKIERFVVMLKRARGVSSEEATNELKTPYAVSCSKWAKMAKLKFTKEKDEKSGTLRYYAK